MSTTPTHLLSQKQCGFTLVELVLVILLLGTLSYYAVSRLSDRADTDAHGCIENVASVLRYAQKAAVAQRRTIYVNIDTNNPRVWACLDNALVCTQPLSAPAGGPLDHSAPNGVTLSNSGPAQFTFDAMGRPSTASAVDIQASAGSAVFTIRLEPESGYVHRT